MRWTILAAMVLLIAGCTADVTEPPTRTTIPDDHAEILSTWADPDGWDRIEDDGCVAHYRNGGLRVTITYNCDDLSDCTYTVTILTPYGPRQYESPC